MDARAVEEEYVEAGGAESQCSLAVFPDKKLGLVHRSHASAAAASSAAVTETWRNNQSSAAIATMMDGHNNSGDSNNVAARVARRRQSYIDNVDLDPIILQESTHTLLFTEPIKSIPFIFSVLIATLSILCLLLALMNNGVTSKAIKYVIPANVTTACKVAQYISIIIALMMEEEIPTGMYQLKRIPRQYFISTFPELSYKQFVFSNVLRIGMGYLFLINVLLILWKASDVMQIFFDFIALQFIQHLDNVAFSLAKMSMLSASMKAATTRRYFRTEFKRSNPGQSGKSFFFVVIYLLNLSGLLGGMIYVSMKQANGDYQCKSITAKFREDIWRNALVVSSGGYEERTLMYSYFNGEYVQDGNMHDGRPIYIERRKFDGTEFDTTLPSKNLLNTTVKIPAKFQYCSSIRAWVFMHDNIRKSRRDCSSRPECSDCPWLLRSEETEVYDIEEVKGPWQVWQGVIEATDVRISCNECDENADCNLNGVCQKDGTCECFDDVEGVTFFGLHCEVILEDKCRTIVGERYNESYSVLYLPWAPGQLYETYNRPAFTYDSGSGEPGLDSADMSATLIFSGGRWFALFDDQPAARWTGDYLESTIYFLKNFHAFWDKDKTTNIIAISDPVTATGYTPVGVDFFSIRERGEQFGPFGAQYPVQLYNQTGRGYFRCSDEAPLVDPSIANNSAPVGRK